MVCKNCIIVILCLVVFLCFLRTFYVLLTIQHLFSNTFSLCFTLSQTPACTTTQSKTKQNTHTHTHTHTHPYIYIYIFFLTYFNLQVFGLVKRKEKVLNKMSASIPRN